jgi:hypothetical protein
MQCVLLTALVCLLFNEQHIYIARPHTLRQTGPFLLLARTIIFLYNLKHYAFYICKNNLLTLYVRGQANQCEQ